MLVYLWDGLAKQMRANDLALITECYTGLRSSDRCRKFRHGAH